ncbi:Zinc finger C2H2-type [Trinorchestia longiramus]|nr:Zinc finger C2H2-type [Trinorchestia longiramus]
MSLSVVSEDDLLQSKSGSVVLSDYNCTYSQAFNEQYEELQKNLVFTPSTEKLWFDCPICKRKSATEERLERHIKQKHHSATSASSKLVRDENLSPSAQASEPFKCTVCKFACHTNADLMRHSKKHWGIKPYVCSICGKRFSQKGNLKPHMLRHSGVSPFACDFCPKTFNHRTSRKKHMEEHVNPKEFACRFCTSMTFSSLEQRNSHELTKHSQDDVDCIICGVILNSALGLKMHISQMHPDFPGANQLTSEKKWACQYCNKKFSTKAYLIVHHKIHSGEKPFKCDKCSYTAVSKDSVKKHVERSHGMMKPLSCNLCSKTFTYYSHKKAHMLRHYNLKPFNCELCARSFMLKRHLNDHMRMHEGNPSFRCELCDVAYVLPDSLRKHKDMHLSTPLKCHICKTDFWVAGRYNRHMQKHRREFHGKNCSESKPYKCHMCSKYFKLRRFLTRHFAEGCKTTLGAQLRCTECEEQHPDEKSLKRHMKIFHNLKEHSCYVCAEAFKRISHLNQHLIEKHNEAAYYPRDQMKKEMRNSSCDTEDECIGRGITVVSHGPVDEPKNVLVISDLTNASYIKEEPLDSLELFYQCMTCDERFDSEYSLQEHQKTSHDCDTTTESIPLVSTVVIKEELEEKESPMLDSNANNSWDMPHLEYKFLDENGCANREAAINNDGTAVVNRESVSNDDVALDGSNEEVRDDDELVTCYECTLCEARFATYDLCERHYYVSHLKKRKPKRGRKKKLSELGS